MSAFTAVKVFSSTMAREREALGQKVSDWLKAHPELKPVDIVTTQTSDAEFHCLTFTVFLEGDPSKYLEESKHVSPPRIR